jgi:hypothetical protein
MGIEVRIPKQAVSVFMKCDAPNPKTESGVCCGHMIPTGDVLLTHLPQYPHRCDICGKREVYSKQYPTIEYEDLPTTNYGR